MKTLYIFTLSFFLSIQPLFAAMTGDGGSSSSSTSSSSSSSSSSNTSSASSYSNSSYSSTGGGGYSSKKDRKKKEFDPFESIYGLIRLEKFAEAHESLKFIRVLTPSKEADKYNLLGFTARKSGDLNAAAEYYKKALEINPKHIQALEYQGELYLQLGEMEKAKKNLEKIKTICWFICKEKKMLEEAIKLVLN
ncbi:tetratricopeptide repeat protein [Paracoccaceae bacterium]|nr:tetratricopeptide repeat protein [Paracoccaceae bacterium]